jgi:3-oxoacyl-[acyl-carrier protein] reductase
VSGTLDGVVRDFGRLDVMINNAGITKDALLVKVQDGKGRRQDVAGPVARGHRREPDGRIPRRARSAQRMIGLGNGGVIISTSSISRSATWGSRTTRRPSPASWR